MSVTQQMATPAEGPVAERSAIKVSVIVAVYNAGNDIDELIDSLRRQTLSSEQFEVIFVDDGSTDGSGARIDALAHETDNFFALHNHPNSGWPGKPRNMGIDIARGKYLFFADNDDILGTEALERLYNYAELHQSDVVIGKMVGHGPGRGIPREIFRRNRPDAQLDKDHILAILTPHKLFRRSMVEANGIRFPEGKVRLEDHLFVMKAYFAARKISVLSDYACYHWMRRDSGNASYIPVDPAMYYASVRAVLDVVIANTEPGEFRNRLLAHWYSGKMLTRLSGGSLLSKRPAYRHELFNEIQRLAADLIPVEVDQLVAPAHRVRAHLVRTDDFDGILAFAAAEQGVRAVPAIDSMAWERGKLTINAHAQFVYRNGSPVRVRRDGDVLTWVLPDGADIEVPASALDVTDLYAGGRLDVLVRDRTSGVVYFQPSKTTRSVPADGEIEQIAMSVRATIEPLTAADGQMLPRTGDVLLRMRTCGWWSEVRLPVGADPLPERHTFVAVTPYSTAGYGNLSLATTRTASSAAAASPDAEPQLRRYADEFRRALPTRLGSALRKTRTRVRRAINR